MPLIAQFQPTSLCQYVGGMGGGYFTKFSVAGFSMQQKIQPNRIYGFVKKRGQKDLKSMKKGGNWIENQGEN